jgi:hypothetical protein
MYPINVVEKGHQCCAPASAGTSNEDKIVVRAITSFWMNPQDRQLSHNDNLP